MVIMMVIITVSRINDRDNVKLVSSIIMMTWLMLQAVTSWFHQISQHPPLYNFSPPILCEINYISSEHVTVMTKNTCSTTCPGYT